MLTESPARKELAKRLMAGQTAVWLLLESGDAAADDQAASLLERANQGAAEDARIARADGCSRRRGSLGDSAGGGFLRAASLAQRSEGAPARCRCCWGARTTCASAPMRWSFRSSAADGLCSRLLGAGITAQNIADAAGFLVGPCSCQLKEFNPGFDLLNMADWDASGKTTLKRLLLLKRRPRPPFSRAPRCRSLRVQPTSVQTYAVPVIVQHDTWFTMLFNTRILIVAGILVAAVLCDRLFDCFSTLPCSHEPSR